MIKKTFFLGSAILLMGLSGTQIYGYLRYGFFPSDPIFLIQSFPSSSFLERTLTAQDGIGGVAIAPDGKTLVSGGEEKIKLWNLVDGKLIRSFEGGINSDVTFSPDGNILATQNTAISRNGKGISDEYKINIKLWDVVTGKQIRTLQTEYDEYLSSFAFSPDGNTIASSGVNKVSTEQRKANGSKLLQKEIFIPSNKTIKLWDVATGKEIRTINAHDKDVRQVVFSPDGTILASTSWDNTIKLWNWKTGQEIRSFKGSESIAISPDGKILVGNSDDSNSSDSSIKLWNLETGEEIRNIAYNTSFSDIQNLTFSPDGKTIAGSIGRYTDGTILLWDVATGKQTHTLLGHSRRVTHLAFTPDGKNLISGSIFDDTIKIWRLSL
jgi:WD40 repeat protein